MPQSYPPCSRQSFVNGILSNTAETNPRAKAVHADAGGNSSTGISEAQVTRAIRNTVPIHAFFSSCQGVFLKKPPIRIPIQTPIAGKSRVQFVKMVQTKIRKTIGNVPQPR